MRSHLYALAGAFAVATVAAAAPPDPSTILTRMKAATEPPQASLRRMTLTVTATDGTSAPVVLGQARGGAADSRRILTVVLAPPELKGTAYLTQEQAAGPNDKVWAWLPAIGRVRTLVAPEAFAAFLNSDFTYSDLGFVSLRSRTTLLEEGTVGGTKTYRIDTVPKDAWYYSHYETTVAADSFMPIECKFFDPANALWKVMRWEGTAAMNDVPTALKITIDDVQSKSKSTITVTDLRYGVAVPDELLQPTGLPKAAGSPLWTSLNAPVSKQ
jgi:hypothetical protein